MKKIGFLGGHSDVKTGAFGCGFSETKLAREIANLCVDYAKKNYEGTFLTDGTNQHSGGGEETFVINNKLDYFCSIHLNAGTSSANGTEALVPCREKTTGIEDKMLNRLSKEVGFKNRGIKRRQSGGDWVTGYKNVDDYYGMLRQPLAKGIHGSILEVCFISNQDDINKFNANKQLIAKIIVESVCDGFGMKRKANIPTTPEKPSEKPSGSEKLWRVCVGTYGDYDNAVKMKNTAIAKGLDAYIVEK